jgi:hypothetical protein
LPVDGREDQDVTLSSVGRPRGNGEQHQPLTATVTATAAANRCHQRPLTAHNSRTICANWGYVRPEKHTVGDRGRPPRLLPILPILLPSRWTTLVRVDSCGMSGQRTDRSRRSWTMCLSLWIKVPLTCQIRCDGSANTDRPHTDTASSHKRCERVATMRPNALPVQRSTGQTFPDH